MPSNKDLKNSISAAAETLGVDGPDLKGKTNAEMADTLKEMNAEIESAKAEKERLDREELEAKAEKERLDREELEAKAEKERLDREELEAKAEDDELPEFYLSKGKAITSRRGILADGDEVTANDLAGGENAIKAFVKSGHISKG